MAKLRIGDILIQAGLLDEMQLNTALAHQRQWGGLLGAILVDRKFVDEVRMYQALSNQFGLPLVSVAKEPISPDVVRTLPPDLCAEKNIFPLAFQERTLVVATAFPQDIEAVDRAAFMTGLKVRLVLCPLREIEWAIRHYHHGDMSPCPAPATRRTFEEDSDMRLTDRSGATMVGKSVEDLRREHEQRGGARPVEPPPASAGAPELWGGATDPALRRPMGDPALQAAIDAIKGSDKRQDMWIRVLVDLCIRKGLFTADEFRSMVAAFETGQSG